MQVEKSFSTKSTKPLNIFVDTDKNTILPALAAMACFGVLLYSAPSIYDFFSRNFFPVESPSFPKAEIQEVPLPSPIMGPPALSSSLNKEHISLIQHPASLKESSCLYKGDLSHEMGLSKEKLLSHEDLVQYIRSSHGRNKHVAIGILVTLLGIKPSYIVESNEIPLELKKILAKKTQDLTIKEFTTCPEKDSYEQYKTPYTAETEARFNVFSYLCITNETPLNAFDPRHFLHPLERSSISLSDATLYCFTKLGTQKTDQMLSYLLGFGPTWESYAGRSPNLFKREDSIFSKNHYEELGRILSTSQPFETGLALHNNLSLFENHISKASTADTRSIENLLVSTDTPQIFDGISARTEYFQKSYTLKKWLLETYFR